MTLDDLRKLLAEHMAIKKMCAGEVGQYINLNHVHVHKFLNGEQGLNGERVLSLLDVLGFEVVRKPESLALMAPPRKIEVMLEYDRETGVALPIGQGKNDEGA